MLIEFKVKNFRSIHQQQTFSMIASTGSELEENLCADCVNKLRLVRAAVIYGANAGGKTNLLNALLFLREFILTSAKESQQGEKIPLASFAFDPSSHNKQSEFEVTFFKDEIRYQYGFSADVDRIFEEWLFAYPSGKAQKWFNRVYDKANEKYSWSFSKFFKGGKQVNDLTRSNVLFLSNAVKLNNTQLVPIFDWFQNDLILINSPGRRFISAESIELLKTEEGKLRILKLLSKADPSIADINLEMQKVDEGKIGFPTSMPQEVQNYFKKEMMSAEHAKIDFIHSENTSLPLREESEGTKKLLAYAGLWLDVLDNGRILIVDELDNSLHPLIVRFLIKLICNSEINKKNAQLIFTSHDTSLLDHELFRRDQIWFVEKDEKNSTHLYPLLDFSPRKGEALERGYLQGRYGALPYIGEWRF